VYHRLGTILGLEAARVALEIETLPRCEHLSGVLQSGAPIALYDDKPNEPGHQLFGVEQRIVRLPATQFSAPEQLEAEAQVLISEMNRLRHEGTEEEIRAVTAKATQAIWRAGNARFYYGKSFIEWEMQCIRIGPIALLSVPGEPFIETAQRIAAASPFEHTLFSGYSNGGFGYVPTREACTEGGYEVEASPFSPDAADLLATAGIQLLRDVAMKYVTE
jgi:hypothetical protein